MERKALIGAVIGVGVYVGLVPDWHVISVILTALLCGVVAIGLDAALPKESE